MLLSNERSELSKELMRQDQTEFESLHEFITITYGKELPPPSPELKYTIVVPAYMEFKHLLQFICSLLKQKGDPFGKIEILYVVNNTKETAESKTKAFQENQSTLALLQFIAESTLITDDEVVPKELAMKFPELSELEKSWILGCIRRSIKIHGIDASSAGAKTEKFSNLKADQCRSLSCNIGAHLAINRMSSSQDKFIDIVDADCLLPEKYFVRILQQLESAQAESFIKQLEFKPELPDEIINLPDNLYKLLLIRDTLLRTLRDSKFKGLSFVHFIFDHGATPIISTSLFSKIGGYPLTKDTGADEIFARKIWSEEPPKRIDDTTIQVLDRLRPESTYGKFSLQDQTAPASEDTLIELLLHETPDKIKSLQYYISEISQTDSYYLQENFDQYWRERYKFYKLNRNHRIHFLAAFKKIIPHLIAMDKPLTEKNVLGSLLQEIPKYYRDILESSESYIYFCQTAIVTLRTSELREKLGLDSQLPFDEILWKFLEKFLPEVFEQPLEKEPDSYQDYLTALQARGEKPNISNFIHIMQANYNLFTMPTSYIE